MTNKQTNYSTASDVTQHLKPLSVNVHLHTPYSFSAFDSVEQAPRMAADQGVKAIGVNDFYSTDAYDEWTEECKKYKVYPLYGIEFIGLNQADQEAGLRVNDPANPGRTYISGKGMSHPFVLPQPYADQLAALRKNANDQVKEMTQKLQQLLQEKEIDIPFDFETIKAEDTKGLVRERHLAKVLRTKVYEYAQNDHGQINQLLTTLFDGTSPQTDFNNHAAVENEIRNQLLKTGGYAFVPETSDAFLPMETVHQMILAGGGIPTYPFLADDPQGNYTDFEKDREKAADMLIERGFYSVEFISTRNDVELLESYAAYLYDRGFVVTIGSEHNTPAMEPIALSCRHSKPLSPTLKAINYAGACIVAAHQHLVAQGLTGYLDAEGKPIPDSRNELIALGDELIRTATEQ